ncbi:MAG: DinB family protein [Bacteroidetes bacterium]|jgi:hypothetical protein|uniref:DinB family protein n=1 Tax=Phnomibacter sp. TaxID=2836217 RepID=UPI002FDCFBDA|nr:DinB family protein [Bacteroidota bacterium]
MPLPVTGDYAPFYQTYVSYCAAHETDALDTLKGSLAEMEQWLRQIPETKKDFAYAPGKWTVAQLLQHMADTERVFAYRALAIARGEQQPLPGFDENAWANEAPAIHRSISSLVEELLQLRQLTITLFQSITPAQLLNKGVASGQPITVNALAFIMVGHVRHHQRIYSERYC